MKMALTGFAMVSAAIFLNGTAPAQTDGGREAPPIMAEGSNFPAEHTLEGDPERRVCIRRTRIGSRADRERICKTRAEWVQQRREMRAQIDGGQIRQTNPGNSDVEGMHPVQNCPSLRC